MSIYNGLIFTEAVEQVNALLTTEDTDEISDRIEEISKNRDLSIASMMLLVLKARGVDIERLNGIELANTKPTAADLILPPGTRRS